MSGAVVCVVLSVNQGFVGRWVGESQYGGFWLTTMILVTMLMRHWNLTVGYTLLCFGFERRLCVTALIDGLVSVGATFLCVRSYGLIGAPIGMLTGVCLVGLPANLAALARETNLSAREMVQPLFPWFSRFIILSVGIGALARIWVPNTLILIGLTALLVATAYIGLMLPLTLREPLGQYVGPRLFTIRMRFVRLLRLVRTAEPTS